jgi:hypothetical protein
LDLAAMALRNRLAVGLSALVIIGIVAVGAVAWKDYQQFNREKSQFLENYREELEREILDYYSASGEMPHSAQDLLKHSTALRSPVVFDAMVKFGFNQPTLEEGWLAYESRVFEEMVPVCLKRIRDDNMDKPQRPQIDSSTDPKQRAANVGQPQRPASPGQPGG